MKTNKLLAGFGLLSTALPPVVLAQVINRPSNDRPPGAEAPGSNPTYLIVAVVVVVVIAAFFFFRAKGKS